MTRTILLADDSVTIQKVVELTFLDEDYRVVAVGNGSDAIDRLGEVAPDIVLADVHMPGADGYELCAAVHERLPGVPVVLLVGTFEVFDAARAEEVQAADHLKKPFDSQDLMRRIKTLLASVPEGGAVAEPIVAEPIVAEPIVAEPAEVMPAPDPVEEGVTFESPEGDSWSFEPVAEPEETPQDEPEGSEAATPAEEAPAEAIEPTTWGGVEPTPEPAPMAAAPPTPSEPIEETTPFAAPPSGGEEIEPDTSPAFVPEVAAEVAPTNGDSRLLSDDEVDRIARRVVELAAEKVVRDIAWEVVPDLAELLLKARIRELEASVE
jgi:CheY-like chemotaxis protein